MTERSFDDFTQAVTAALSDWRRVDLPVPPALKQSQLLCQAIAVEDERLESVWRMVCNKALLNGIDRLAGINSVGADILRMRYADDLQVNEIVPVVKLDRHQIRRREKTAVKDLSQLLWQQEQDLRRGQAAGQLQALSANPPYTQLFGVDETAAQLKEELLAADRSWLVVVAALGGSGKTSITDYVIRQVVPLLRFEETLVEYLPAGNIPLDNLLRLLAAKMGLPSASMSAEAVTQELRRIFKARPWLVWVDGLEADISHLTDGLMGLANPSKFILTSRHRPTVGEFFVKPLQPLSATAAAELLRDHARRTGREQMATAPDEQITAIYDKVGGNPLALKIIVGLSDQHSIPTILNDLTELKIEAKIEKELYTRIYQKAWYSLTKEAQTALKAMVMVPPTSPSRLDYIADLCGDELDLQAVSAALDDLIKRSLVEPHGSPWDDERRYGIHSLTRTFLHTDIFGGPPPDFI